MGKGTLDNYLNNAQELSKTVGWDVLVLTDRNGKYSIIMDGDIPEGDPWYLTARFNNGHFYCCLDFPYPR